MSGAGIVAGLAPPPAADALKATVILTLTTRKPSAKRKARDGSVEVRGATAGQDPDEDSTTVSVDLIRAEEYGRILALDTGAREMLKRAALPAGKRIAAGSYLLPIAELERVVTRLESLAGERKTLVRDFAAVYPRIVADAAERLGDAFDPRMFPGVEVGTDGRPFVTPEAAGCIAGTFGMTWDIEVADREAGIRAAAQSLSPAFVAAQLAKARVTAEAMLGEVRDGLRVAFSELVESAAEQLKPVGEDGRRRVFRAERLEAIQSFLSTFEAKNVVGDGELGTVVAQARALLGGMTPDEVRDAKSVEPRRQLAAALETVKASLVTVAAPKRRITLGDD